jgi:hypothetical protein
MCMSSALLLRACELRAALLADHSAGVALKARRLLREHHSSLVLEAVVTLRAIVPETAARLRLETLAESALQGLILPLWHERLSVAVEQENERFDLKCAKVVSFDIATLHDRVRSGRHAIVENEARAFRELQDRWQTALHDEHNTATAQNFLHDHFDVALSCWTHYAEMWKRALFEQVHTLHVGRGYGSLRRLIFFAESRARDTLRGEAEHCLAATLLAAVESVAEPSLRNGVALQTARELVRLRFTVLRNIEELAREEAEVREADHSMKLRATMIASEKRAAKQADARLTDERRMQHDCAQDESTHRQRVYTEQVATRQELRKMAQSTYLLLKADADRAATAKQEAEHAAAAAAAEQRRRSEEAAKALDEAVADEASGRQRVIAEMLQTRQVMRKAIAEEMTAARHRETEAAAAAAASRAALVVAEGLGRKAVIADMIAARQALRKILADSVAEARASVRDTAVDKQQREAAVETAVTTLVALESAQRNSIAEAEAAAHQRRSEAAILSTFAVMTGDLVADEAAGRNALVTEQEAVAAAFFAQIYTAVAEAARQFEADLAARRQREEAFAELLTEETTGRQAAAEAQETARHTLTQTHLTATEEAGRRADAQRREREAAVEAAVATLVAEETDRRNAVTDAQATAIDQIATDEADRREVEAKREREAAITSAVATLEIEEADGREALAGNEATTVSSMAQTLMVAVDASRRDAEAAHRAALASAIAALVVEEAIQRNTVVDEHAVAVGSTVTHAQSHAQSLAAQEASARREAEAAQRERAAAVASAAAALAIEEANRRMAHAQQEAEASQAMTHALHTAAAVEAGRRAADEDRRREHEAAYAAAVSALLIEEAAGRKAVVADMLASRQPVRKAIAESAARVREAEEARRAALESEKTRAGSETVAERHAGEPAPQLREANDVTDTEASDGKTRGVDDVVHSSTATQEAALAAGLHSSVELASASGEASPRDTTDGQGTNRAQAPQSPSSPTALMENGAADAALAAASVASIQEELESTREETETAEAIERGKHAATFRTATARLLRRR